MPHTTPTPATKPMQQLFLPELVRFQRFLALVDEHVLSSWVEQEIAVSRADGAVATAYFLG